MISWTNRHMSRSDTRTRVLRSRTAISDFLSSIAMCEPPREFSRMLSKLAWRLISSGKSLLPRGRPLFLGVLRVYSQKGTSKKETPGILQMGERAIKMGIWANW